VFLYANGYEEGVSGFMGDLPEGVSFSDSRQVIHDRLGEPTASGGGSVIQFFGKTPAWDRFDRTEYSLHIQYAADQASTELVTIMRPGFVPK
jgi:hypothetical protein